jgi:hypothetical protein
VLIQATFIPAGEVATVDAQFPEQELPLSLAEADANAGLEGQPEGVTAYRLAARVNDYNVDLFAFFGGERPSAEALAAADEKIARLVIPEPAVRSPFQRRPNRVDEGGDALGSAWSRNPPRRHQLGLVGGRASSRAPLGDRAPL